MSISQQIGKHVPFLTFGVNWSVAALSYQEETLTHANAQHRSLKQLSIEEEISRPYDSMLNSRTLTLMHTAKRTDLTWQPRRWYTISVTHIWDWSGRFSLITTLHL